MLDPIMRDTPVTKLHDWNIKINTKHKQIPCETKSEEVQKNKKKSRGLAPITWTVSDLAKAGCLLTNPPQRTSFEDEQEMRRVYTLIYDVFRYKNVLNQALNDVSFFQIFPALVTTIPQVWLLFYDLYHRSFKKRETKVAPTAMKLFDSVGITYAENALWTQKVKLAAAVARLRIKHNALCLSELLPPHLKDERVTEQAKNNPVTCWVNSVKVGDLNSLCKELELTFSLKMVAEGKKIGKNNFKWDRHCPLIMAFHASMRTKLARSPFVRDHILIVQDKSFCFGPATFGQLIADLELSGNVIQTHINSPRTTAYLATILSQNERIKNLMAFSAGKRKSEYESYFTELGMTNISIYSDRLIDTPLDANYMEEVVAVFATPPNSYSAVVDPIDLVCSRGGDLSMLEVLTETGDTKEARERISSVLEEQRRTLKFAMSKPQIQFILYETHSELEAENTVMVDKAMKEINKIAKYKHAALQGKIPTPTNQEDGQDSKEINNNEELSPIDEENDTVSNIPLSDSQLSLESIEKERRLLESIKIPDTDLFVIPNLPNLCSNEICKSFEKEGCYLALLKRKRIIRLDDKYMIQMAENRGLFGSTTTTGTIRSKSSRSSRKKQDKSDKSFRKKKIRDSEVASIQVTTKFMSQSKECEPIETREAGIVARENIPRNILGKLSSAHIRQFVCPFFKQKEKPPIPLYKQRIQSLSSFYAEQRGKDMSVNVPSKINNETSDEPSDPTIDIDTGPSQIPSTITEHYFIEPKIITIPAQRRSFAITSRERVARRMKKIDAVLARVSVPTQSSLLRMMKEDENLRPKKPAIEYTKRIFRCAQCRKRNTI